MKTISKVNKEPAVGYEEVDKYFAIEYFIHRWVMGKEERFLCNKIYLLIYNY